MIYTREYSRIPTNDNGKYIFGPYLIEFMDHSSVRWTKDQPDSGEKYDYNTGQYTKTTIHYRNNMAYSDSLIQYYNGLFRKIKDINIVETMGHYNSGSEKEFKQLFGTLNEIGVKKVIRQIFETEKHHPEIDSYIEEKYPDLVSEMAMYRR